MSDVSFDTPAGPLRGHLATPATAGPWPGVVVVHEAYGLTDEMRAHAARFATHGYLALVPDLYSWGPTARCVLATFRAMLTGAGRAFDDIEAARAWLAAQPGCAGRVGVIGFCMGGGFALMTAPRAGFAAASVNYGRVPPDAEKLLAGACPIVGSFGGRDWAFRGHAARLERALTRLEIDHDVKEYPDASHAFFNDHGGWPAIIDRVTGFGRHEPSAEDAWRRTLAFFERHVRAAQSSPTRRDAGA
jgi:carboxymethylenebutenolidase